MKTPTELDSTGNPKVPLLMESETELAKSDATVFPVGYAASPVTVEPDRM